MRLISKKFIVVLSLYFASFVGFANAEDLQIKVLKEGTGAVAEKFAKVSVHYTGWLLTGEKFDSSVDRGRPFDFTLGVSQVIKGWDQGVEGMKVGGKRELIIPSHLAYGERGAGADIPPNATLKFEVELLGVSDAEFKRISAVDFSEVIKEKTQAIDMRRADEWAETGVIAGVELMEAFGADNRFKAEFVPSINGYANRDLPLYVIGSAEDLRAASIAGALATQAGFSEVILVIDGIEGWVSAGYPVQ